MAFSAIFMVGAGSLLRQRGYEVPEGVENAMIPCPFHDDENPSLSVHTEQGVFKCFSCEEQGSFVKLIAQIDDVSHEEAKDLVYPGFDPGGALEELDTLLRVRKPRYVDDAVFGERFPPVSGVFGKYLKTRGIGDASVERWGIRCCREGKYRNRVIVPIRDHEGRMVSFCARSVFDNAIPKTRKLKRGAVRDVIFGRYLVESRKAVLVEGELDCIYLQSFGIPAVASMGKDLSEQRMVTLASDFDYVYISYDADDAGRKAAERHRAALSPWVPVSVLSLPKGCDPNDLSPDQVKTIYRGALS